jgi:hypothetical protein
MTAGNNARTSTGEGKFEIFKNFAAKDLRPEIEH